jgi:cytochrome P450
MSERAEHVESSADLLQAFRANPIAAVTKVARDHGDVASITVGRYRVFLLSHPDHIKDVLVTNHRKFVKGPPLQESKRLIGEGLLTSEGDFHRSQRRIIQPVFHHERMLDYAGLMVERAGRVTERWRPGEVVDAQEAMVLLTMSVLAKSVLDADIADEQARETARALAACLERFLRIASPYARLLDQVRSGRTQEFEEILHRFDETVARIIRERKDKGTDGSDVLSRLMRAGAERPDDEMPERQLRDEILTFMIAGHETWSNSMAWTWYLLSEHPEFRERLHAEVDAVLGGRPATAEDVEDLRLVRWTYLESLRLYPPVWLIGRAAAVDHELDGHTIPAGSVVLISPWVVHRDPRWYPDAEEFRPERWDKDAAQRVPTFAYLPFSAGRRVCIGQPLATLSGTLFLSTIAQRWRLDIVPGHPIEPAAPLLRPRHGMPMIATPRDASPAGRARASVAGAG